MTLSEFADIFAMLAVQLRQTDADEATIRSYFEALKDLDLELVRMAADVLAKTWQWFPKTSEWRAVVERVKQQRVEQQRTLMRHSPEPWCDVCGDTGWEHVGDRVRRCSCAAQRRLEVLGRRS